jgi:class 3 adenylate cyclase
MVENVTLLYSDIVGFTAICSSAEPIEIGIYYLANYFANAKIIRIIN